MLKNKTVSFAILILCFFTTMSRAQNEPETFERYVIVSFENTRFYTDLRGNFKDKQTYYWISPVDSLLQQKKVFPLYLSSSEDYLVLPEADCGLGSLLGNINGEFETGRMMFDSGTGVVKQLVRLVERNKKLAQSSTTLYRGEITTPRRVRKEKLDVYVTSVMGDFQKRLLRGAGQKTTYIYFPIEIIGSEPDYLSEGEWQTVFYYDYTGINYESFLIPLSFYDKGHGRASAW